MKKTNKKYLMFGMLGLFALALVSAISYYAIFTVTLNVTNPIQITGDGDQIISSISPPEVVLGDMVRVDNNGDEDREIVITANIVQGDSANVEVNYVGRLELDNKIRCGGDDCSGTCWDRIDDEIEGELYYFITGNEFGHHFEAQGLEEVEYSLIYYADDWPGNNPGALIGKAFADSNGDLVIEGSVELNMNLPSSPDENALDTCDYCDNGCNPTDGLCRGAKIWLVPSDQYNEGTKSIIGWSPTDYWLFETDLILYFDNADGKYTIDANSDVEFYPLYDFDQHADGEYIITTEIA